MTKSPATITEPIGDSAQRVRLHPDDITAIAQALYAERNKLVSLKGLALAIGENYRTVQRWAAGKWLPYYGKGKGAKRYNVEEVLAALRRDGRGVKVARVK
jgi:hypothetical protein